jgi:hypothetical protein
LSLKRQRDEIHTEFKTASAEEEALEITLKELEKMQAEKVLSFRDKF